MKMEAFVDIDVVLVCLLNRTIPKRQLVSFILTLFWESGFLFKLGPQINFLENVSFNLIFELEFIFAALTHLKLNYVQ